MASSVHWNSGPNSQPFGAPHPTLSKPDPLPYAVRLEQLVTHVAQAQPLISGAP